MDLTKKTVNHRAAKTLAGFALFLGILVLQFSLPRSLEFYCFLGPVSAWAAPPVANAGNDQANEKDQPLAATVLLNGSGSSDPDGDSLIHSWYGPFTATGGETPSVTILEGSYTVSLIVNDGTSLSEIDTTEFTISSCFNIAARCKRGKVQLTWSHIEGTERYDVYRTDESDPFNFEKIAETTSTYSTYLDTAITNEVTYLYVVGALSQGTWCYSNVISSHPTAIRSRGTINYAPVIYSSPITHGTAGYIYNYDVNGTDPNANTLSYSLLTSISEMNISSATGLITWTPGTPGLYDVIVQATDGNSGTDSQSFTIDVIEIITPNQPPIADAGGPYSEIVGQEISFNGSGSSDPENDPLSYTWDFGDNTTGSGAKPVHAYSNSGIFLVTLTVDDGNGGTDTAQAEVVVNDIPNIPPVADAGINQTYTLPDSQTTMEVTLDGSGSSDEDGTLESYIWTGDSDPENVVQPLLNLSVGTYTFTLVVTDNDGAQSEPASVTITIQRFNHPPAIEPMSDQNIDEMKLLTFQVNGTDPDGDDLTYSADNLPDGGNFDAPNRAFSWTPNHDQAGSYTVTFIATDTGGLSDAIDIPITVNNVNRPPALSHVSDRHIAETKHLTFQVSAFDPDGNDLTYSANTLPTNADFNAATQTFSWTPADGFAGTYQVGFSVSDGSLSDAISVRIFVTHYNANNSPFIEPVESQEIDENQQLTFQVAGSDPNGEVLVYSINDLPTGAIFESTADPNLFNFMWTPGYDQAGTYTVSFTATDPGGLSDTMGVDILVNNVNRPPLLDAIADKQISETKVLTFQVTGSDPDDDNLTFTADNLPVGAAFDAFSQEFSWTPTDEQAGEYEVNFGISDGDLTDTKTARIVVMDFQAGLSPSLAPVEDQAVDEGQALFFQIIGNDPNNDLLTYATDNLPEGALFEATTDTNIFNLSWTPGYDQAGTYTVGFTATDPGGLSDALDVNILVNNINRPPLLDPVADQQVNENALLAFQVTGSDPDNDAIVFSATGLPAGASLTPETGAVSWIPTYDQAGTYPVMFSINDGKLTAEQQMAIEVMDINRPPMITTTEIPDGQVDQIYQVRIVSQDPDEDTLTWEITETTADITINDATGDLSWDRPSITDIGTYSLTVQVADGRGGSDSRLYSFSVPDSIPPAITLNAPIQANPGTTLNIEALSSDNDAIAVIEIHGIKTDLSLPYPKSHTKNEDIMIPSELGTMTVLAAAWDPSGNRTETTASIEVVALFDTTSPEVALSVPPYVTQGQGIILTALVSDDTGVSTLYFFADGNPVGTAPPTAPSIEFSIPGDAENGQIIEFSVEARDFSGNSASDEGSSEVVVPEQTDTTPPDPEIEIPESVTEDETIPITLDTPEESCLARIDVYINHTLAETYFAPDGQSFDVPLPEGVEGGMDVLVEVVVTDCSGNQTTTTISTPVHVEESGRGVIAGEVYNDQTGLPIENADVVYTGDDASTVSAITDGSGQYSFAAESGTGYLVVSKSGFSRVTRAISIEDGTGLEVLDARLTPLSDSGSAVSSTLGGILSTEFSVITAGFVPVLTNAGLDPSSIEAADISLEIPSGALAGNQTLTLTQISPQGLAGLLPAGWSPVGVVDISPHHILFRTQTDLSIPNPMGFSDSSNIVLAMWDEVEHVWQMDSQAALSADGSMIHTGFSSTGQFAFILPDELPLAPPAPDVGEAIQGVASSLIPDPVDTIISPEPGIIFYLPGVHSDVGVSISNLPVLVPSSTPVLVNIDEEYNFYSGDRIVSQPYTQDILLYSLNQSELTAGFPVTPSYTFEPLTLDHGVINVDLLAPQDMDRALPVVPPEGGIISLPTGEAVTLPQGISSDIIPVTMEALTEEGLGIELPPELLFLGGVLATFSGNEFDKPVILSVPVPAVFVDQGQLFLVQLVEVQGATRMVLKGIGVIQDGSIVSVYNLPDSDNTPFEGILTQGRYIFIQTQTDAGFAHGTVFDADSMPLEGAIVSSSNMPVVSISDPEGDYVSVINTGIFTLTALDPEMMDSGSISDMITGNGEISELDIFLIEAPPHVVSFSPVDGAENVPLETAVKITFSEPLDAATVTAENLMLTGPEGPISGTLTLTTGNTTAAFRPTAPLTSDTTYLFTVTTGVKDLAGYSIESILTFGFTCLDTQPPPPPPAGSITATIPDGETGRTTITTTQGTAGPHDTVSIINKTQGTSMPVLVEADGSFSVNIDAEIIDEVVVSITDPAGNETVVSVGPFRNPDGSTVIGPQGGQLEAENGVILDIPPGAFPNGAIVRITGLTEAEIGVDPGPDFPFVAGFELNCSVQPEVYMNASAPMPQGTFPDARGIVARVAEIYDGPVLGIVDTAKVINGRLATSSPPCPGLVYRVGRYSMYLNENQMMAMGEALMSMIAPSGKPYVMNPLIEATMNQYTSWFPAYADVFRGLYHASASPASQEYPGEAYHQMHQQICMPVPADEPLKVRIEDAETGELIDIINVDPIEAGGHADITIKDYEDTEGPTSVGVIPLHNTIGLQDRKIKVRFSEPISWQSADSVKLVEVDNKVWDLPDTIIVEEEAKIYEGKWELSENNCLLTFETDRPLALGKTYRLNLADIKDLAGNAYSGEEIRFETFEPYVLFPSHCGRQRLDKNNMANDLGCDITKIPENLWFIDVDFKTRTPAESHDGKWHTDIVALQAKEGRSSDYRIFTIDASDPTTPSVTAGFETDSNYIQRSIHLLEDVPIIPRDPAFGDPQFWKTRQLHYRDDDPSITICADPDSDELNAWLDRFCSFAPDNPDPPVCRTINGGCGDLAVTTVDNTEYAYLWSYDVTDRNLPDAGGPIKWISSRLLSDNGAGYGNLRQYEAPAGLGTIMGLSTLRGMDISHDDIFNENTVGVYVANYNIGLELVDLGLNIPTINDSERQDQQYPPANAETLHINTQLYYRDVSVVDQKVVAIAFDLQQGTGIKTLEIFRPDLAGEPVGIVPLTNKPKKLATVADFPIVMGEDQEPTLFDLAFVTGEDGGVSVVEIPDGLDGSGSPYDIDADRNLIPTPDGVVTKHIRIDPKARVAYVAALGVNENIAGDYLLVLDVSQPFNASSDIDKDGWDDRFIGKIPITLANDLGPVYLQGFRLDTKRGLIYAGIYAGGKEGLGIIKVRDCPDVGVDFKTGPGSEPVPIKAEKYALQQVIRNGLAEAQSACDIDPITLTMIEQGSGSCIWNDSCGSNYQPGISDHDFEVFFPPDVSEESQQCVIDALYKQVTTIQSDPIPVSAYGYKVLFKDITFYPMDRYSFESAKLDLNRPAGTQGDTIGDMGLGRQQLLLKWLIEGRYVDVPGLDLKGIPFSAILEKLKDPMDMDQDGEDEEPSHIQRLEGYEWARLQEAMIYKSGALIRVKGASAPGTTLHKIFTKELHTVAKAAIRAVLARIIANDAGNALAVNFEYGMPPCVDAGSSYDPFSWNNVECESFSHYITSLAARMVRDFPDENLFTPEEISDKITKFYKVKAGKDDEDDKIDTEEEAIDFIRGAFTFIADVGTQTKSIYNQTIGFDPRAAKRIDNMAFAENQITNYKKNGKKHIIPRFFNNSTIVMDSELQIRIYKDNQEMENRDIWINAGDYIHLDTQKDPPPDNDDPEVLLTPRKNIPVFSLGLDQTDTDQNGWVSIFVDIPNHNIQERYRENNWKNLFYYVLDPDSPLVPSTPSEPKPEDIFGPPDTDYLASEPACTCEPQEPPISVVQSVNNESDPDKIIPIYIKSDGTENCFTIEVNIENSSTTNIKNVTVSGSYADKDIPGVQPIDIIPAGETESLEIQYCSDDPEGTTINGYIWINYEYEEIGVTGTTTLLGTQLANFLTLDFRCPYAVIPLDPNPNPEVSVVDADIGHFCRHYQVVNMADGGSPVAGAVLAVTLESGDNCRLMATVYTDENGYVETNATNLNYDGTPAGGNTVKGLCISLMSEFSQCAAMDYTDPIYGVLDLIKVGDKMVNCSEKIDFAAKVETLKFEESLKTGSSSDIEASILFLGGSLKDSASMEFKLQGQSVGENRIADLISVVRRTHFGGDFGIKGELAKLEIKSPGVSVEAVAGQAEAKLEGDVTWGDQYDFPTDDLSTNEGLKLIAGGLMMKSLVKDGRPGIVSRYILQQIENAISEFPERKVSEFWGYAASPSIGAKLFEVKASAGNVIKAGMGVSATAEAKGAIRMESEDFINKPKEIRTMEFLGSFDAKAGLDAFIGSGGSSGEISLDIVAEKFRLDLITGEFSRGMKLVLILDQADGHIPVKLEITPLGKKGFGFMKTDNNELTDLGQGGQSTLTYSVTDQETIMKLARTVLAYSGLLTPEVRARAGGESVPEVAFGPSAMWDKLLEIVTMIRENAEYRVTREEGQSIERAFEFSAKIAGTGGGIKEKLKTDKSFSFELESGVWKGGHRYMLQQYPWVLGQQNFYGELEKAFTGIEDEIVNRFRDNFDTYFHAVEKFYDDVKGIWINRTQGSAELAFTNETDFNSVFGPLSIDFQSISGPLDPYYYAPGDIKGSGDKPHYGIGGFHEYFPTGHTLSTPATMTIDYDNEEIVNMDEDTLAIYSWNYDNQEWDYVDGTHDAENNTITIDITELGVYTIGPAMPAGRIQWADKQIQMLGENTILTLTSEPLVMNNGDPVPDGIIFHATSLLPFMDATGNVIPFGTVVSQDWEPMMEGVQVISENGVIRVVIEYPNEIALSAKVVVFSDIGTTMGDEVISLLQ